MSSMTSSQPSSLLPALFAQFEEEQPLCVLHIGAALPETVNFFSSYRCKLHFFDLFSDLAQLQGEQDPLVSRRQQLTELLPVPAGARFDLCLFWDLFNFMDADLIADLLSVLRPHLHPGTLAHGFAVHNLKTPQSRQIYGLRALDQVSLRERSADLPGYCPHNQGQLEKLLDCFHFSRSVLLPGSRLEMLLSARL